VSAQLIEAEKTYKRASKTAETYKVQVSKLNPTGVPAKRKFAAIPTRGTLTAAKGIDKDLEMQLMEQELAKLRDGVRNKESSICVVS
jgi:hypothetical protein